MLLTLRGRSTPSANSAHIIQSRSDSGLGLSHFQLESLQNVLNCSLPAQRRVNYRSEDAPWDFRFRVSGFGFRDYRGENAAPEGYMLLTLRKRADTLLQRQQALVDFCRLILFSKSFNVKTFWQ